MNTMGGMVNNTTALWQTGTALVAIAIFVGTTWFVIRQCASSYVFMRRLHAGTARAVWWRILLLIVHVAWNRPASLISRKEPLLVFVRIRAEHEIFDPRPVWKWPLPDDDDEYGIGDLALNMVGKNRREQKKTRKTARSAAVKRHREQKGKWLGRMNDILDDPDPDSKSKTKSLIRIDHAGMLNNELSTIKRYFDTLKTMNVKHGGELKFQCSVAVKIGFIASQHLIAGLLVRYNQNWKPIIDGFEKDTNAGTAEMPRDVRQIQSFIYNCWLLWGPSIPICASSCHAWQADFAALQFGYGDENNAIEIVGEAGYLREKVMAQINRLGTARTNGAMALPAGVRGRLEYSSIVERRSKTIPPALTTSWKSPETERPVLMLSHEFTAEFGEDIDQDYRKTGGISGEDHGTDNDGPGPSRYYSAYFWIMFVVLHHNGTDWVPLYPEAKEERRFAITSSQPWKGAIPFFEHGNMADPESCQFSKRQLAVKTIAGIAQLGEMAGCKLKFAYVCAIDHSNCSQGLAFPELVGGSTVRDIVRTILQNSSASDPIVARAAALIDFDYYDAQEEGPWNPHSACEQTTWVRKHYDDLEKRGPVDVD